MNILSLFDGISCGQIALHRANIPVTTYYSSEIDAHSINITQNNYPDTLQLGNVENWENWNLPKINILMGGSPCQGFSKCGNRLNFNDPRSKLFFHFVDILNSLNPTYFLLENVRMIPIWRNIISKYLQTEPILINSSLVSAQNRERYYWTNIKNISIPEDKHIYLKDIIHTNEIRVHPRGNNKGGIRTRKKCPTITSSNWQYNFHLKINNQWRMFTPEECEILQTIPKGYTNYVSKTQRYKAIGNAWTVDIISYILNHINSTPIIKEGFI